MKRYMYLKINKNAVFFEDLNNDNIENYYIVEQNSLLFKLFRKLNILNKSLCFGKWKYKVKKCDYIILGENGYTPNISKYIKMKNPKCKIIMYYWNILNDEYKKILKDENIDEFWTFDKREAEKYKLKYNPQFYSKRIIPPDIEISKDVVFMGRAKERKKELKNLEEMLKQLGIKTNFFIIEKEKDLIKYSEYLKQVYTSKCILDYNQEGQIGLTLRPMEALFYQKKLITNNKDIINYDFYNSNNIFVLGIDDINKVKEFIERPYQKIDEKIVNYYDYESWLKRFKENKNEH